MGRARIVAVSAGALLLGACFLLLGASLDRVATDLARDDVAALAQRRLALAENRLARVIGTLDDLATRGVGSCSAADLKVMQQAAFASVMIKEISVIGPDGHALCATSALLPEARKPISLSRSPSADNIAIEIFRFGESSEKILRIRRMSEQGTSLGAVLLASNLIARNPAEGAEQRSYSRLEMPDGTLLGEIGLASDMQSEITLSAGLSSAVYGINLSTWLPHSVLRAHKDRIMSYGLIAAGAVALLLLVLWLLRRPPQRDNPIAEIEHALKAGEFVPYYQPIVDLVTGKLRGAEVLIRWHKPDGSTVSPAAFIPLAESSGIILEMTRALMRKVCQEMGPAFAERPHLKVCFNLAARHFQDESIVQDVREIFGRRGSVRLSQVVLEVTERQPIDNLVETRRLIAALQGLGVRMAIDDVGTGHSGLSYILKLGVDIIKIDKMFVDAIGIERSSTTIIETLIDLAHNMRMDIVAEGVETFEQVVCLRERGIRAAQGFVFAPALPGSSFLQLVEAIEPVAARPAVAAEQGRAVA